jgi:hypothetical protein
MPDVRFSHIGRHLDVYEEPWQREHDQVKECFRLEDRLAEGVSVFQLISRIDENWHTHVSKNPSDYDADVEKAIARLYERWLRAAKADLEQIELMEGRYGTVQGADEFQRCCSEAEGLLTSDAVFFSDDALIDLRDNALDGHRRGDTTEMKDLSD